MKQKPGIQVVAILLLGLSGISNAAIFSDNFDDPDFTNSHWVDGNPVVPQTWSFTTIGGTDLGYHASIDVPPLTTEEPAVKVADNGREYYSSGLYIETYARIDSHPDSYITENKILMGFGGTDGVIMGQLSG